MALASLALWLLYSNNELQKKVSSGISMAELARAPEFSLASVGGDKVSLKEFEGQAGMLLFFDGDCGPCDSDADNWNAIARSAHSQSRFFIAICQGTREEAVEFSNRHGLEFRVAIDEDGKITDRYNVPGVPFIYAIDKTGSIRYERTTTEANCIRLGFTR